MPELDANRAGPPMPALDAATLVVARPAQCGGIDVFCVVRHPKAGFLGGAVVFPGGKVDGSDLDPEWASCITPPQSTPVPIAADPSLSRGLAVAACREALEEAAILPVAGGTVTHAELLEWRTALTRGVATLRGLLVQRNLRLDLASLHPLARWVTPLAEPKRFDTRFFLFLAKGVVTGAHDDYETTASFWATPAEVLARYSEGKLVLSPPTHRTLQVLSAAQTVADAVTIASQSCLEPICPRIIKEREGAETTIAVVLPGDPEHDVRVARVAGPSRYVLRNGRFWPGDA